MDEHVIHLSYISGVFLVAEPTEPVFVQVHMQRRIACHQHIQTHIELLASYKEGVVYVAGNDIGLFEGESLEGHFRRSGPFLELV